MTNHDKIISLLLVAALFASGCNKVYRYDMRSYVQEYGQLSGIVLAPDGSEVFTSAAKGDCLSVHTRCKKYVTFKSDGEDKRIYDSLCVAHNDMTYNRKVRLVMDIIDVRCTFPDVVRYDVVSNIDFDDRHPAGSLLNDLMTIRFHSVQKYIDSGYTGYPDPFYREETMPLPDMMSYDMRLLCGSLGDLIFTKKPDVPAVHRITVSVTTENGKVYSDTIEYDFT